MNERPTPLRNAFLACCSRFFSFLWSENQAFPHQDVNDNARKDDEQKAGPRNICRQKEDEEGIEKNRTENDQEAD